MLCYCTGLLTGVLYFCVKSVPFASIRHFLMSCEVPAQPIFAVSRSRSPATSSFVAWDTAALIGPLWTMALWKRPESYKVQTSLLIVIPDFQSGHLRAVWLINVFQSVSIKRTIWTWTSLICHAVLYIEITKRYMHTGDAYAEDHCIDVILT
jgi:hypothetical protein